MGERTIRLRGTVSADNGFTDVAGGVASTEIANSAITAAKLATDAVETAKIKDANVTHVKLATDAVESDNVKDANVTLAKLAAGITPSHVVKYAGTVTWADSGASKAFTITGLAATDIVVASFLVAPTEAAYLVSLVPTTNTLTITLSAANTTNDAQISYVVYRAVA